MKIIGIMAVGTYYSPWTPYAIASIYNHVDKLIIVNGGFDLNRPKKREYTVPLEQVTMDIIHLDINSKITEKTNFSIFDIVHKYPVAREYDKLWDKNQQIWYDQRGLNLTLAHETAVERGADIILKIDSDQVCYADVKKIKQYDVGQIFHQYEFIESTEFLANPPPDSPFNDSVYTYKAKSEGFYGGGGAPAIQAQRHFCSDIHCAHLRFANPHHLSYKERLNHFYGRKWFAKYTNEGLWGKPLHTIAMKSALDLTKVEGKVSDVSPPEVTKYKDPLNYITQRV